MDIELLDEPTTALTVTARAALALSSDQTRKDLKALVAKSANIKEVKNAAGRDEAHGAAMTLVRARTTIEKTGKAARDDATKFSKAIIAEEKSLIAITEGEEARLLALRDEWDNARAAEKAEAERIERARIEQIHLRIADIRACPGLAAQCKTSVEVEALIQKLTDLSDKGFEEFAMEASVTRQDALASMREISDAKFTEEQERARIKAEQEAEAARLTEERAELERQRKEAAEAERIAAQERAEQEAKAQAAREAAEAAAKVLRDAEAKRLADERAAFEAEQAEARAATQAEADRVAAERAEWQAEVDRRAEWPQAEVDRRAAEAKALETTVTEIEPEKVEVTGPAPLETDPIFHQADGSDDIDGPQSPSDADVIACAATAVSQRFDISFNDALNRLAEIQEWVAVELAD